MKFKNTFSLLGMTTVAAAVLATAPAHAATVADPVNNDIFVGFRASGGTGASTSLLVNLGQYSVFRDQVAGTTVALTNLGDIGADLVSTFGANWNTRSNLFWGIFGHSTGTSSIVYGSKEQLTVGVTGTAWPALDGTSRNGTDSQIASVIDLGYRGSQSTANSNKAVLQANSNLASSYNKQVATAGTTDFGSISGWQSIEGDFGGGASATALDLFRIAGSGVTNEGYFTINNGGTLSFTAVPEPSGALLGAIGTILLITQRRRQTASR